MQHQFKAGDLALVIGSDHEPCNAGKVCELVIFLTHGDVVPNPNCPSTLAEYDDPGVQRWLVKGESIQNDSDDPRDKGLDVLLPEHLMPLKGDQSPVQTNTETPKEVAHG